MTASGRSPNRYMKISQPASMNNVSPHHKSFRCNAASVRQKQAKKDYSRILKNYQEASDDSDSDDCQCYWCNKHDLADYPEQQPAAALEHDEGIQNSDLGEENKSQVLLDQSFIEPPQQNDLNWTRNKFEPNFPKAESQNIEPSLIVENREKTALSESNLNQTSGIMEELTNAGSNWNAQEGFLEDEKVATKDQIQSSMSSVANDEPIETLEDLEPCLENDDNKPKTENTLEGLETGEVDQSTATENQNIVDTSFEKNIPHDIAKSKQVEKQSNTKEDKLPDKPNESQTVFPDSVYEPFARKNFKSKTSVQFTALPVEKQPPSEKLDKTLSRRTTSAINSKLTHNEFESSPPPPVLKYFSRQNSNPANMQTSTFDPIKVTSENPELAEILKNDESPETEQNQTPVEQLTNEKTPAKEVAENVSGKLSPLLPEIDSNVEPENDKEPELDAQNVEPEEADQYPNEEAVDNNDQPKTHRIIVPIKLPKSHTDSSPTVTNHFYDGSNVNDSPPNGRASKSTILPALKSLNGKKGKSSSVDEPNNGGAGIILPNIEPPKAGMEGPRGELRKQHSMHNMGNSSPTKQKTGGSHRQTSNNESSPARAERPEMSTIRGPHPKWLVNHNHLQQKRTSILSESLPVEEKLLKRQKFMVRSKRFQDPLNSRLNLVPGLTEKENSSFHEIRQKLGQIENKIEHIIKHSSHLSRSIDRPNSDSFVETNRHLLVPRNHHVFLQQASMINASHGAFSQFFDTCKGGRDDESSFGEGFEDDKKLNVVNLVLDGENSNFGAERNKGYPFSFAMEPGTVLHQINQQHFHHQLQQQQHRSLAPNSQHSIPITPGKIPLLSRAQQETGAKSYISANSHPLHSRQPTQTMVKTSTPPGPSSNTTNMPKVRRKERTSIKNKTSKTNSQKTKASLTVKINDNATDRASETSSEGKRTIDETIVLRTHGEIELSPW